ncbi:MAG: hypothetical protein JXQ72_11845, partial [Anaerolineae bacterium]|nr:hypothetical protein [Anaerolineae bacterium]
MNNPDPPVRQWHVHPWPPLAWAETVIKLVAMAVGLTALVSVLYGSFVVPGGAALAQFLILIALAVGLVAAIVDRFIEREVIAMFFVIGNNAGHWSMVIALA